MKNKNMVLLALAVGCGLVAAFLTAKLGAGGRTEMVPVLVAAKNLDQGTKLDKLEEQFVRKPFPHESVPPEFVDDATTLKGKTLQRSVRAGSHVTMADVTPRSTIELPVDPKTGVMYKAMALRVAPETVVGGLVLPGARVDVLSVETQRGSGKTVSSMILQNVLVVGVDVNTSRPDEQHYIKNAQTVTLAVKQSEGLVLALAQKRGEVSLMLRSPDDDKVNKHLKSVTDYVYGDKNAEGGSDDGSGATKPKILVAREPIPAGTKILEPEHYFAEIDWAGVVPDNYITKFEDVKGKVVGNPLAANAPVMQETFDDTGVKPIVPSPGKGPLVAANSNAKIHTMIIQQGGAQPYYARYRDGKLETSTGAGPQTPGVNGSAVINPGSKSEGTKDKDETGDESKDDKNGKNEDENK